MHVARMEISSDSICPALKSLALLATSVFSIGHSKFSGVSKREQIRAVDWRITVQRIVLPFI